MREDGETVQLCEDKGRRLTDRWSAVGLDHHKFGKNKENR